MAIGDDATAAGYPIVPNTGPQGLVSEGAQEINRSRDFIAQLKALLPVGKNGYRAAAGFSSGWGDPSGGSDGDIYFKIIS